MDRLTATNRLNDGGRLLVENPQAADLDVPLTNSIIPQRGIGAISYTRATIATVTDHEGVIRNCLSGEARFQGARRVRNLTGYSQALDNASWTKNSTTISGTKVAYADGSIIGQKVIASAATAQHYVVTAGAFVASNTFIWSASIKAAGYNFAQLMTAGAVSVNYQNFDLINGVMTGTAGVGTMVDEGDGWWRCSMKLDAIATLSASCYILIPSSMSDTRFPAFLGDAVNGIYVTRVQLEDVTGQSVQTASEYVSTNVLNAAPYHGSNVDGVKCFKTTLAGLPISPDTLKGFLCEGVRTNLCNYSNIAVAGWGLIASTRTDNAGIAPDGTNSMVKIIPNAGTQSSYAYNVNITTAASIYTISCYVKADGLNFVQLRMGAGISSGLANFDLLNGVVGTRSIWTSSGIEAVSGFPGVYRIWAVTDTVLAATAAIAIQVVPAANSIAGAPVTGDGVSGILAWGMQIELGPNVSTYIPTTTVTVTRNPDVLSYDIKNGIANQGAFSTAIHLNDSVQFDRRALSFSNLNQRLQLQITRPGSLNPYIFYGDGAAVQYVISSQPVGDNNIVASWLNGVGTYLYMNNTKYSSAGIPNLLFNSFDVGGGITGAPIFGCMKNLRLWKTVPTDAELLSLSNQS